MSLCMCVYLQGKNVYHAFICVKVENFVNYVLPFSARNSYRQQMIFAVIQVVGTKCASQMYIRICAMPLCRRSFSTPDVAFDTRRTFEK